jgi:phage repressor protein C with HTH and peptisase S24 domain
MTMEDLSADGKQAETDDLSSFPTRLKQAMGDSSIRGFARECGFSDTVLRQYLNGQSEPTRPALLAIARTAQVSLEWLAVGEVNSSGRGSSEYVYKEPLAFSADWLKDQFPDSYDHLLLAQVPDESMEPTLKCRDLILVDTQDRDFETINHGIFLLQLDSRILVKRLQYIANKTLRLLSDNSRYESFSIDYKSKSSGLSVMGRVVWSGHKF